MRIQTLTALGVAVCLSTPVVAQTVDSQPVDPRKLERTTVKLLDRQPDVKGLLAGLMAESVTVLVGSERIEVPLAKVRRVDVGGDSVLNGAVIGGLVTGVWCALICGQGLRRSDSLPGAVVKSAGMGTLIGLLIDGTNSNRRTVYRAPSRKAQRALRPALTVTFRF